MVEPDAHAQSVIASFFGGVLWGIVKIFTILFGPTVPVSRDIYRAFFEACAAVIAACIGGYYVAPAIMLYFHAASDELKGVISVIVGILFWQSIPIFTTIAPIIIRKYISNKTASI